jgi:hypothetical protein
LTNLLTIDIGESATKLINLVEFKTTPLISDIEKKPVVKSIEEFDKMYENRN